MSLHYRSCPVKLLAKIDFYTSLLENLFLQIPGLSLNNINAMQPLQSVTANRKGKDFHRFSTLTVGLQLVHIVLDGIILGYTPEVKRQGSPILLKEMSSVSGIFLLDPTNYPLQNAECAESSVSTEQLRPFQSLA